MGEVWAVRNQLTNRDFAVKFLLPEFWNNGEAFERFLREAETTGKLRHPGIVDVFDVAQTDDGRPYIVMELLAGEELGSCLDRVGTLAPLRVAEYFSQLSGALQLAHRAGVVHRDLSSANVFLARGDAAGEITPKILDFGVSKIMGPSVVEELTGHGAVLGSPSYMSPEQACGADAVDERTDVWSLGVLMYRCLSGTMPFHAKNYNALMVAVMTETHRPLVELVPSVDSELVALVGRCLIKDRNDRIGSAGELSARLGAITRRLATEASDWSRTPKRRVTDRVPLAPPDDRRRLPFGRRDQADDGSPFQPFFGRSSVQAAILASVLVLGVFLGRWNSTGESETPTDMAAELPGSLSAADETLKIFSPSDLPLAEPEPPARVADNEPNLGRAVARGTLRR
ncbi:MAG: serine/threonine protein kinase [Polyangiaceae bacterium]|nr:serine/threonine protein kinase [Polyangiaceae bacterium]